MQNVKIYLRDKALKFNSLLNLFAFGLNFLYHKTKKFFPIRLKAT